MFREVTRQAGHTSRQLLGRHSTRPGVAVLLNERRDLLNGRTIGLVSNAASVTGDLVTTAAALQEVRGMHLAALFAPEHGFYGAERAGTPIADTTAAATRLPVYSLYGDYGQRPSAESLAGLDMLIYDMQSVGARFYTYLTTLFYLMKAAAEQHLSIVVCDRPNPIGGEIVEGPVLEADFASFVGCGPIPIRHGLTIGEAALFFNEVWAIGCDLTVISCDGWRRSMWFDETGLTWVPPSPNMPRPDSALLYLGLCLFEGTNLSEGRGTPLPFEIIGAPWLDGPMLAERMNALALPGVKFRALRFTPSASKWQDQGCFGVQLHVTDRPAVRPITIALYLISLIRQQHKDHFSWKLPHFDHLAGTDSVRQEIERETAVADIINSWASALGSYAAQRQTVLLYDR